MKKTHSSMLARVHLLIRNDCRLCDKVERQLSALQDEESVFQLHIINVEKVDALPFGIQAAITPSVWINSNLWSTGEIDSRSFIEKISGLY